MARPVLVACAAASLHCGADERLRPVESTASGAGGDANEAGAGGSGGASPTPRSPTTTLRAFPLEGAVGEELVVALSEQTLGATFAAQSPDPFGVHFGLASGQPLVEGSNIVKGGKSSVAWTLGFMYPDAQMWTLPSGFGDGVDELGQAFTVRFGVGGSSGEGGGSLDWAVAYAREGTFTGGVVDFNVFVSPELGKADHVRALLAVTMQDFAGLGLGDVDVYDLPSSAVVLDDPDEVLELVKATAVVSKQPSVDVMVAGAFGPGFATGSVVGRSPLPGMPMRHGDAPSAIWLRLSDEATYDGIILRHELGHYAGLFHSEEMAVSDTADAFADTPDCEGFPFDCPDPVACGCDVTNLMFPMKMDVTPVLSPSQVRLVQGSILYRDMPGAYPARRIDQVPNPADRTWRARLSGAAQLQLGSICAPPARALAPTDRADLLALAEDSAVTPVLRRRAVELLGAPLTPDERARTVALLRSRPPADVRRALAGTVPEAWTDADRAQEDDVVVRALVQRP